MTETLERFTDGLLHLDDLKNNFLLNISGAGGNAFVLSCGAEILDIIKERAGKPSNKTVLAGSALIKAAAETKADIKLDWRDMAGEKSAAKLDAFISAAYSDVNLKGNNPLYLGAGLLEWEVAASDGLVKILSPLLIFPVRLVRGTKTSPVEVEFPAGDIYFNPCLAKKMETTLGGSVADGFPKPQCSDGTVDLDSLDRGYFDRVKEYVKECSGLAFNPDFAVISLYNHADICMYYDVRAHRDEIEKSELVKRVFSGGGEREKAVKDSPRPKLVLPCDSVQESIIRRICAGESMIIKGPPGTGKTLTIANMAVALMAKGKKAIFVSKKLSALSEAYAKIPEKLRKFALLLDYETERNAAKVDPTVIKAEMSGLIRYRREFTPDIAAEAVYARSLREKSSAVTAINAYKAELFGADIAGGSYFDALDKTLSKDTPAADFADGERAAKLKREEYLALTGKVRECAEAYISMSECGRAELCPWFGIGKDTDAESAFKAYSDICRSGERVLKDTAGAPEHLTLVNIIAALADNVLTKDEMSRLLACTAPCPYSELEEFINAYNAAQFSGEYSFKMSGSENCPAFEKLILIGADGTLTRAEAELIAEHSDVFVRGGRYSKSFPVAKLCEIFDGISALSADAETYRGEARRVLDRADEKQVLDAYSHLRGYGSESKPRLFDFKAKAAYKTLCKLSSRRALPFDEAVNAAASFSAAAACDEEIKELRALVGRIAGRDLSPEEYECVKLVTDKFVSQKIDGSKLGDYLKAACDACGEFAVCLKNCVAPENACIGDVIKAYRRHIATVKLSDLVRKFQAAADIKSGKRELPVLACSFSLVLRTAELFKNDNELVLFLSKLNSLGKGFKDDLLFTVRALIRFGRTYFAGYYTKNPFALTLGDLKIFVDNAENRAHLYAADTYRAITQGDNALPLDKFFSFFERGEIAADTAEGICEIFEKSLYKAAVGYKKETLGKRRNGLGKHAVSTYEKLERAEESEREAAAAICENLCMSRISADDPDFAFLKADKGAKTTLRRLFKDNARAILKLKSIIILSPSTASVLFGSDEYSHFDTVIIDEASQSEPVTLLPVLFRAKQCVIVGDEYQMPPITRFKAKNADVIRDEESELLLGTDISALSLALANGGFVTAELVCHYRSRAESLICFSQREFYPAMRTFPAAAEFDKKVGFYDVYTPGGRCDGGANETEAGKAIETLRAHFDEYFDEESGKLLSSVGVVAFGEKQLTRIKKLFERDKELRDRARRALENFDDVPEKLIFFATIDGVQGQECDHLILSLTYGRDPDGRVVSGFGELNRDAFGKCIFNVAVTRARDRITVIHSVKAADMPDNPRISYIKDYLALSERFSKRRCGEIERREIENGKNFIADVVEFIEKCGIDRKRIVTGYGATDGSVRIPVAVLTEKGDSAALGIWCETPVSGRYDYIDYNVRYYTSLCERGWNMHRIFLHDWTDNAKFERAALAEKIEKIR